MQQLTNMKRFLVLAVFAFAVLIGSTGCDVLGLSGTTSTTYPAPPRNNDIRQPLPSSYTKTLELKKPKMVFFSTSYDPTSPDVKKKVAKAQKEFGSRVALVRVNAESPSWTSALMDHKVRYFPTIIVLDQNNKETKRFEGYVDQDSLNKEIKDLL